MVNIYIPLSYTKYIYIVYNYIHFVIYIYILHYSPSGQPKFKTS